MSQCRISHTVSLGFKSHHRRGVGPEVKCGVSSAPLEAILLQLMGHLKLSRQHHGQGPSPSSSCPTSQAWAFLASTRHCSSCQCQILASAHTQTHISLVALFVSSFSSHLPRAWGWGRTPGFWEEVRGEPSVRKKAPQLGAGWELGLRGGV